MLGKNHIIMFFENINIIDAADSLSIKCYSVWGSLQVFICPEYHFVIIWPEQIKQNIASRPHYILAKNDICFNDLPYHWDFGRKIQWGYVYDHNEYSCNENSLSDYYASHYFNYDY